MYISVVLKVSQIQSEFMRSSFLPKCKPKLQEFRLYHTNKDRSTFFLAIFWFFGYDPCLFGRAEILAILGLHLGAFHDYVDIIFSFSEHHLPLRGHFLP
jgi:hypothetical protein